MLRPFYAFQDEISFHAGILLKGERIIIPTSARADMLNLIHQGHFGIEKCKQRARFSMYWPGIDKQIEQLVSRCSTCLNHRNKQRREELIPHEVPDAPWIKCATDVFHLNNRDYLILVDYYSKFIAVSHLKSMKSSSVIKAIKHIFSIHGIPKILFSDNGPEYSSREFGHFSSAWDFFHDSSSPEYPQSNGLVEREIQTVKKVMLKAEENGEDPYLGLLNLNATPLNSGLSPAEMMFNRRIRTLLPSMRMSPVQSAAPSKTSIRERYNQGSVNLKPIPNDATVRIYSKEKKDWSKKGRIVNKSAQPRSYKVLQENGNVIRRNRRHLIPSNETFEPKIDYDAIFDSINATDNKIDTANVPTNDTGSVDINTSNNSATLHVPKNTPYRSRLRQNIMKPDRYGYK